MTTVQVLMMVWVSVYHHGASIGSVSNTVTIVPAATCEAAKVFAESKDNGIPKTVVKCFPLDK